MADLAVRTVNPTHLSIEMWAHFVQRDVPACLTDDRAECGGVQLTVVGDGQRLLLAARIDPA